MKSLTLLCLLLLSLGRVFADGAYKHLFLAEPAAIPRQSAAISFAEGKETLTIWNTVEAKGQDLAWVLPLPAKPGLIRASHPHAFKLLQLLTAPRVEVNGPNNALGGGMLAVLLLFGLGLMLAKRPQRRLVVPSMLVVLLVAAAVLVPSRSGTFSADAGPKAAVEVLSAQDVGNYETSVISGTSALAVNDWLRTAGFSAFTGDEVKVLEQYVSKQWVFLCSRLKTTASGPSAGHPLSVRFPVEKPVYPMSLTKSAGTVPVEIFWMGNPVRDPSGRLQPAGIWDDDSRFGTRNLANMGSQIHAARAAGDLQGFESLKEFRVPEDRDLLLDQMLTAREVIRFTATFTSGSDWSDLHFEPVSEMPELPRHVTRGWLIETAIDKVASKVLGVFLLLGLAAQLSGKPGKRPHILWAAAGLLVLTGAAWAAWSRLPKDVVIVENSRIKRPVAGGPDSLEKLLEEWVQGAKALAP